MIKRLDLLIGERSCDRCGRLIRGRERHDGSGTPIWTRDAHGLSWSYCTLKCAMESEYDAPPLAGA